MSNDAVTILFATRGRVEQAQRTIEAVLKKTKHPIEIIPILDDDDDESIKLFDKLNFKSVIGPQHDENYRFMLIPKINQAFRQSEANYFVGLGDDATVSSGWLSTALECFQSSFPDNAGVLAFNDGGKWRGDIAINPLVSREFIDKFQRGKWYFYPEYFLYYTDTEITVVSKLLDRFVYCPKAKLTNDLLPKPEDRGHQWWNNVNRYYHRDVALFNNRVNQKFPGYGPSKVNFETYEIERVCSVLTPR